MNTEIIINTAVVLITLVIVLAIGLWALNSMMDDSDDAEPIYRARSIWRKHGKRGGK